MKRFKPKEVLFFALLAGGMGAAQVRAAVPSATSMPTPGRVTQGAFSTETLALVRELQELNTKINQAKQELTTDTQVAELSKQFDQARRAYDAKLKETVQASTETVQLREQIQAVLQQLQDRSLTADQRGEIARQNRTFTTRLRQLERGARSNAEVAALAEKSKEVSAALEARTNELLMANPKSRALVERREELQKKINAAARRRTPGGDVPPIPAPQPLEPPNK